MTARVSQDEAEARAAGIAGRRELAAVVPSHRVRAAEVEVQPVEAHQLLAPALQLLQLVGLEPALAVEPVALDVHPREGHGLVDRHAVLDHVHDHLRYRRAQPVRPARADHQPHRPVTLQHRRRLHAGEPMAGAQVTAGRQVLLTHHVVQVQTCARDDHARVAPVRRRERGRVSLTVDHRDVRRAAIACQRGHAGRRAPQRPLDLTPPRLHLLPRQQVRRQPAPVQQPREARVAPPSRRSHRLRQHPQRIRLPGAAPRRERLQRRQHVGDQGAARRRRRVRDQLVPAVRRPQRPPPHRPV